MELQTVPLSVGKFTPLPLPIDSIPQIPAREEVFAAEKKKTDRTYWVNVVDQSTHRVECKAILNRASYIADAIRSAFRRDPIWIYVRVILRESHVGEQVEQEVYLKKTREFTPVINRVYRLEPPVTLEGSGRKDITPTFIRYLYHSFQGIRPGENPQCITRYFISDNRYLLFWTHESFLFERGSQEDLLGYGAASRTSAVLLVQIMGAYHFRVSRRALQSPINGKEKKVTYHLPQLEGLSHPHLGIPKAEDIRYYIKSIKGVEVVRNWCRLTYRGKDLYKAAATISSERDLCLLSAQILSGAAYLHEKGYIHGDLKLQNCILYTDDEGSKIVKVEDLESAHKIRSTPLTSWTRQTITHLSIDVRKSILEHLPIGKSINCLSNDEYTGIWDSHRVTYKETFQSECNTMGFVLAELYLIFRKSHSWTDQDSKVKFENIIQNLTGLSLRLTNRRLPQTFSQDYMARVDQVIRSTPKKNIKKVYKSISSLSEARNQMLDLYHIVANPTFHEGEAASAMMYAAGFNRI